MQTIGVLPDDADALLGSLELSSSSGRTYCFEKLLRKRLRVGQDIYFVRVFVSSDRTSWTPIPMKVDLRSTLYAQLVATWPPPGLDSVELDGGLVITFHDGPTGEKSLPPDFLSPSQWRATYKESKCRWSLVRLRKLQDDDWGGIRSIL